MVGAGILGLMEEKSPIRRLDGPVRRVVRRPVAPVSVAPEAPVAAEAAAAPSVQLPDSAEPAALDPNAPVAAPLAKPRWGLHWSHKRTIATVTTLLMAVVAVVGIHAVLAARQIVTKNSSAGAPVLHGTVDPTKLKGEGDGRINVLLLGIGGGSHDGGNLSDTMMVASIDPVNKTVAMLSIPRDLYVKIPGYGYSKINAANVDGGPELAKQVVSQVLDLPIHYYVQLDFSGFKQAVDAVGGVNITNTTQLYDTQYPCDNDRDYCTFNLPPGQYAMNGELALKYARCRHGTCGNDFGRAARQQQLLVALRQKALQVSTLSNPVRVTGLIDSISNHVRTDLQPNEMQKMASIVKGIDISKAQTKVLDDTPGTGLLLDSSGKYPGAGSILLPKAGDFDYTAIQELAHSLFPDGYIKHENASVAVANGTLTSGLGAAVTQQLTAYGYNVTSTTTAPDQTHTTGQLIDYSGGKKPYTIKYLEERFHTTAVKQAKPVAVAGQPAPPDIGIIVGSDYSLATADAATITNTTTTGSVAPTPTP